MKLKYLSVIFFLLFCIAESFSLPRFALRGGSTCNDCHVNPTGGEMRTSRGWSFGKGFLPMEKASKDFAMSNKIGENIQFGLDFRGNTLVILTEDAKRIDFQRMAGSIYANVDISEKINIYSRYDFIWAIWEAYAVARILPNDSYIKGGSFTPNFGIRLDDHTAYTRGGDRAIVSAGRAGLIYNPEYVETGIELGINIGELGLFTASVGNPRSPQVFVSDPSYTASLQINPSIGEDAAIMFGGSFANFKKTNADFSGFDNVNLFGGFLGFGIGDFTLMGEYDIAQNYVLNDSTSAAMMVEAAYKITAGLEAVARLDRFDPLTDHTDDELTRLVLGFEIHPYNFIEIRPQFRLQMEDPSVENNSIVVQFHLWY